MEKKYECPFLHSGFDITWNDNIRACCAVSSKNHELDVCSLKKVTENNISSLVSSLFLSLKKFHDLFYKGIIPETCKKCNLLKELGANDTVYNKWLGKIDSITVKHYKECNLRCYYCNPIIDKDYYPTDTKKIALLLDYLKSHHMLTDSFIL